MKIYSELFKVKKILIIAIIAKKINLINLIFNCVIINLSELLKKSETKIISTKIIEHNVI